MFSVACGNKVFVCVSNGLGEVLCGRIDPGVVVNIEVL